MKCIVVLASFSSQGTKSSIKYSSAVSDLVKKHPSPMLNLDPTQDNTKIHDQTRVQIKTNGTKIHITHQVI